VWNGRAGVVPGSVSTNFLSDQDVTTPAHIRHIEIERVEPDRPARRATNPVSTLLFLAAVWLTVSAVPVAYMGAGRFDAFWSDLVVGLALCVVTLIRLIRPGTGLTAVTLGLGLWLVAAPFLLGYPLTVAMWNDLLVGLVVLALAGLGGPPET
jgi:hypothetical protein